MPTATEERIRACLIREGVCEDEAAGRVAAVIAEEIERGDDSKVSQVDFDARISQLDATVANLGREMAERNAELFKEMRDFVISMQAIEHERDERERQRDEREREREANWEDRYTRFQRVVYTAAGAGVTVLGVLIAVFGLVA